MDYIVNGTLFVPGWIQDLESFRRWCLSGDYPEEGDVFCLGNQLWVDLSCESVLHNQLRLAIVSCLVNLNKSERLGRLYGRGMRLVAPQASLSTEPDGFFATRQSLQQGSLRLPEGEDSLEVIGAPDMTLEVVNPVSVKKDTVQLLNLYHRAGIREYWLVDPLGADVAFTIYRFSAAKYSATRRTRGWLRSEVFGKSFRLVESKAPSGLREFTLEFR